MSDIQSSSYLGYHLNLQAVCRLGHVSCFLNVNCGASFQTFKEIVMLMSDNGKESFLTSSVAWQYLRGDTQGAGSP